mmetsp:Transcript_48042/g.127303  ORF Transcript_48042/g.127303 Transcript_48042/m.127303 type:complete len:415 (+) Transcript_48042:158-1402(+)
MSRILLLLVLAVASVHVDSGKRAHAREAILAAAKSRSARRALARQAPAMAAPVYIPSLSAANLTKPTMVPPLPPTLNPVEDYQPLDTAIGDFVAKQFVEEPTVTPPPTQAALDTQFGCPEYLTLPDVMYVSAPRCGTSGSREGKWIDDQQSHATLDNPPPTPYHAVWNEEYCLSGICGNIKYVGFDDEGPSGYFASKFDPFNSVQVTTITDCARNLKFIVEERVYKQTSWTSDLECHQYGSCDGTVFLTYTVKDHNGKTVAFTPTLKLFQNKFPILATERAGTVVTIAEFVREGAWNPQESCPTYAKNWAVRFLTTSKDLPDGTYGRKFVVGALATIIGLRDDERTPDGLVGVTGGLMVNWLVVLLVLGGLILLCCGAFQLFAGTCAPRLTVIFKQMERDFFPNEMHKPSKFDP